VNISEKPWDGSASRFTPEQWRSSCVLHLGNTLSKSDHKLPVKEPDGSLSRAGVHAAASRFSSVDAPPAAKAAAKSALRGAYRALGETPPDNIAAALEETTMDEATPEEEYLGFTPIPWHGVLAPEGVWSGDKRRFKEGSLSHRPLPLPLTWQKMSADGHKGNVVVAKIEKIKKVDGEQRASGHFLLSPEADEVVGMIGEFGQFGVSVDADSVVFDLEDNEEGTTFSEARVSSACIVPIPAFAEAWVALGDAPEEWAMDEIDVPTDEAVAASVETLVASGVLSPELVEEFGRGPGWVTNPVATRRLHAYWTHGEGAAKIRWGTPGDYGRCVDQIGQEIAEKSPEKLRFIHQQCAQWQHDAIGVWPGKGEREAAEVLELSDTEPESVHLVASAAKRAPASWFANPNLTEPTALTVTDEGQVYGHIAAYGTCHIGFDGVCVEPPREDTFAYFRTGQVPLDDGTRANTGVISVGGGHANGRLGVRGAIAHYDSTSTAAADVAVGSDQFGIWVAGWVRPGVSDEMVNALMASKVSGDWRTVAGNLTLVAVLAVNVPGFGVPRPQVAVANGEQISLVAAGVVALDHTEKQPTLDVQALAAAVAAEIAAQQKRKQDLEELKAQIEEESDALRV
jgi:hypothetical protein